MNIKNLNLINKTQEAEKEAVKAAKKEAAEKAVLEAVEPKTILDMIQDIYDEKLLIITNDDGDIIGINCPKAVKGISSTQKIGGHMVMGSDEENMAEDAMELKKFLKAYEGQNIMQLFNTALLIKEAGLRPEYAEEINGIFYFVINDLKKVIDERGNTIIDLSKEIGRIDSKTLTRVLVDELHLTVKEEPTWEDFDLPGDSYGRGFSDGYKAGYDDAENYAPEEPLFYDNSLPEDYKEGYRAGYEVGFEDGCEAMDEN
jgi:hypothetical protein